MKRTDHQTIQQVLDGSLSRHDFEGFQRRMREEPELARLYGEYALLHHSLCEEFEDQPVPAVVAPVSKGPLATRFLLFAIAAAVLLGVYFFRNPPAGLKPLPRVAAVELSPDAVWQVEGVTYSAASPVVLKPGATLKLTHGRARISPAPGASALVEGPATLTFVSTELLHLAEGSGRFRLEKSGGKLEVSTPSISVVDVGTEFCVATRREQPDEVHVADGKVLMRVNGKAEGVTLATGEAGRVSGADGIDRFEASDADFPKALGGFDSIVEGPFLKGNWRIDYGKVSITEDRVDGENFSAFLRLPVPEPSDANPVLLATLVVGKPAKGEFHTDGWAGLSFFSGGEELAFFGDSFGPERTWSLDVKQRVPVILPGNLVVGPKTVTLRYDRRTGDVSLHEGGVSLGPAFCSGKLPVGATFDDIRLGASSSAALAVSSLTVRVGGGSH